MSGQNLNKNNYFGGFSGQIFLPSNKFCYILAYTKYKLTAESNSNLQMK